MSGLLRQAKVVKKADPVLAYYVLLWAAQKGLEIRSKGNNTPEVLGFLSPLLDQIEQERRTVQLPQNDAEYVTEKAFKAFLYADNLDRSGVRTKATASAFRAAALTFECIKQFMELPEEISTRMKYGVWRASQIMTKLNAGEQPDPPPHAMEEEEELSLLSMQEAGGDPCNIGVNSQVQGLQFFDKMNQDIAKNEGSNLSFPSVPGGGGGGGGMDFPSVPGTVSANPVSFDLPSVPGTHSGIEGDRGGLKASGSGLQFPSVPGGSGGVSASGNGLDFPSVPGNAMNQPGNNMADGFPTVPGNAPPPAFPAVPGGGGNDRSNLKASGNGFDFPSVPGPGGAPPPYGGTNMNNPSHPSQPQGPPNPYGSGGFPAVHGGGGGGGAGMGMGMGAVDGRAGMKQSMGGGFDLPSVPKEAHRAEEAQKTEIKATNANDDSSDESSSEDSSEERELKAAPKVTFGKQSSKYKPNFQDIANAQKHSKMAYSALNFEDIDTSVKELCTALKSLTGMDFEVRSRK
jgi:hypothetical protein